MNDLIKINYDDFYKFLVSTGIMGIILLFVSVLYLDSKNILSQGLLVLVVILFLAIIFLVIIGIGLYFWSKRQKKHDQLLEYDVNLRKLEVDEKGLLVKKLDLQVREDQYKQKSSDARLLEYKVQDVLEKVN